MFKEFKEFAMKGNVIDMAVGIIIGASFGAIVNSFVSDIIMPPIGMLIGKVDFSNLFIVLREGKVPGPYSSVAGARAVGASTINYGIFINTVISFLIVAFSAFMLVRSINRVRRQKDAPAAVPSNRECPYCFFVIPANAVRCGHCTSDIKPG